MSLDLQLPVQSVPITTKVVSLNPVHCEVYWIKLYVIKFVSDLRQDGGVVIGTDCTGSCKSNHHTITTMMVPSDLDT
jgi:hypothetical protein